ncbi:hypothetical protein [Mycobacterium spongiae]|uniref:Uncharacterized protein n=1 Tax=Mycobacterium spongiae TaxID=886343 RepID=A0A975PVG0_9MYCO|nr:hypothetical protein [Mycobacterium spongiae]QUR65967.1 hypothetical protein F6B93_01725 [Mycobacterium spongiae]
MNVDQIVNVDQARIAALEESQAKILAALEVIGGTQRVLADAVREYINSIDSTVLSVSFIAQDTNHRTHAIEESTAEIKDLLVRGPSSRIPAGHREV